MSGKEHAIACIAGWHHAVKHIHTQGNILQDIDRCTHSHKVSRLILGENIAHQLGNLVHLLSWFSYREPAYRISISPFGGDIFSRGTAQVSIYRPLYNRKKRLVVAILGRILLQVTDTAIQPAMRHVHRALGIGIFARIGRTFVKGHDNISPYATLYFHRFLRRKKVIRAVNMAFESHAFFLYLSGAGKRIHLISPTIGKDISVPVHKLM